MKTLFYFLSLGMFLFADERVQMHMGTLISVNITEREDVLVPAGYENLSDEVFALFKDLDEKLSTYKSDSEISRLNRDHEANLSDVTRTVLERSIEMNHKTQGAFDITIGSLSHGAYHFGTQEKIPTSAELHHALTFVGGNHIWMDHEKVTVTKGTIIDLGGIGKGYAVDLSVTLLEHHGVKKAVIAASGDIGCLGKCEVRIQDPFHPKGIVATVTSILPRFAISTSGNYERYIRNKEHNHLLNPKTGKSEQNFASITLFGKGDNTALDAIATGVSIMRADQAIALLERENIGYFLIQNDGHLFQSKIIEGIRIDNNER
ncbi:MAG: FAD:protein FMN transferase [Sulfuricurvum sp.]|nr:FAD:protein FMN transferase [Sulfuricurvum sp.]